MSGHGWPVVIQGHLLPSGQLQLNRALLTDLLRGRRECEVEITIRRAFATRSAQANRYYWGVVLGYLSEHTGHTPDELHDICKAKFLPKQLAVCDHNGEIVGEYVIGGSTAGLGVEEFAAYVNAIVDWARDALGVSIPPAETP